MRELREGHDIRMLWHGGFYDGPLDGIAEHDGRKVWFTCVGDPDWGWRRYEAFALTDAQIEREVAQHDDFNRNVGTHTNYEYVDGWRRRVPREPLRENWHDWFDQPREAIDRSTYHDNPIGWFSRSPHNRRPRSRRYFERRLQRATA